MKHRLLFLSLSFIVFFPSCQEKQTEQFDRGDVEWSDQPEFWIWYGTGNKKSELRENYELVCELAIKGQQISPSYTYSHHNAANVPVLRLPPGGKTLKFKSEITEQAAAFVAVEGERRLQFDYDCAAANLGTYASFLKNLRQDLNLDFLSVTALASWVDVPEFGNLEEAVDELVPMFYDLEPVSSELIRSGKAKALVNKITLDWIGKWSRCRVNWKAGLPNFQRLTLYQNNGELLGHLRKWSPDDLIALSQGGLIAPMNTEGPGSQTWSISEDYIYEGTVLEMGQRLVWTAPDDQVLRESIDLAKEGCASGIVWFAHPDSAPVAWH